LTRSTKGKGVSTVKRLFYSKHERGKKIDVRAIRSREKNPLEKSPRRTREGKKKKSLSKK